MQEEAIFIEALEKEDPADRADYLHRICADDPALRERIDRLLMLHQDADNFLDAPADRSVVGSAMERPGAVIGPYKLLEQIGEGGFGLVFMADQKSPVRRKVAIKVLKPGMDSRQVIARFEAERQALALMDHANIARVLEAGQTDSGRPYFAMELVRGVPITAYCDQNGLTPRQRLGLFLTVCQAVQHAHHKGIIHRDIKPSNVLVTLHDGAPVAKVIDFGVAKALGQSLTDKTVHTGFAQIVGTPLYMSPEQAEMSGLDIDTRTDIYSLGVLLYELLTGTTPFDKERLSQVGYDEMRRIIREEEPARPSSRVSTLGQAATTMSHQRQSEPRRLSQLFKGELDWIVMKALEKDRNRRYETASAFAADIERYLRDEAVLAHPPSSSYLFWKFVRRRRGALTMAAVVVLAVMLVAGSIGWAVRDRAERDASAQRDQEARDEKARTDQQAREAKARADREAADAKARQERAMREAALDDEVARACNEAAALIDEGQWPAAAAPVHRAEKLLNAAGRAPLPPRLVELRRDLDLLSRLDRVLDAANKKKTEAVTPAEVVEANSGFTDAFRDFGIDVPALAVAEAAQRIRARSIRVDLAAALDYWATKRKLAESSEGNVWVLNSGLDYQEGWKLYLETHKNRPKFDSKHLLRVAKLVDPEPWRNQVRDAIIDQKDLKALSPLAASADMGRQRTGILLLLADALLFTGDRQFAVSMLRKAQSSHPADVRLNEVLGDIHSMSFGQPQHDEALRFYAAGLAVRPDSVYLRCRVGDMLAIKNNHADAIVEYSKAIELDPHYRSALLARGRTFLLKGEPRAIGDFSKVIESDPAKPENWNERAAAYQWLHQWDKAIEDYNQALKRSSKSWASYIGRGQVHAAFGRWDKAADDFDKVLASHPDSEHWGSTVACYRAAAGDMQAYRQTCERLRQEFGQTKDSNIAQRIALSCLLMPDTPSGLKKSIRLAEFSVAAAPQDPWTVITHATALYRSDDFGPAAVKLHALLKTWPQDPYARPGVGEAPLVCWILLGMTSQRLGHSAEARRWLEKAGQRKESVRKQDKASLDHGLGGLRIETGVRALCFALRREAEALADEPGANSSEKK